MLLKIQKICNKRETCFKERILAGLVLKEGALHKKHHICADKAKTFKNIKAGTYIDLYESERLQQHDYRLVKNKFIQVLCKSTQEIEIKVFNSDNKESYRAEVKVDGREIVFQEKIVECVKNEGFIFVTQFLDYITQILPKEIAEDAAIYRGTMVHWTDLRY